MKKLQLFDQNHGLSLCKKANFAFFVNPCLYCLEKLVFYWERHQILFLGEFCIKRNVYKISNFWPKLWTNPFEKCQFCSFLTPMFLLLKKACLLYKTSKIVFSRFIFPIYDIGIQGVTKGYMGLRGVKRGDNGLQGITRGYKGLQGVTGGYRRLQKVTRGYKGWKGVTGGYKGL